MGRGGQPFEHRLEVRGQPAEPLELHLVCGELGLVWERAVDQEVRDLLELRLVGEVENVVAAIVEIVAGSPDGA